MESYGNGDIKLSSHTTKEWSYAVVKTGKNDISQIENLRTSPIPTRPPPLSEKYSMNCLKLFYSKVIGEKKSGSTTFSVKVGHTVP